MPIYEHACRKCGPMELERRMADPQPTTCPQCGRAGLERIYNAFLHAAVDSGQENQNGGMGMFYPEAGPQFLDAKTKTRRNPDAHARSRFDMMEKLKRRGYGVSKY